MSDNLHLLNRFNHVGLMILKKNDQPANYGSIRVENGSFFHHSGKGLREMFPQNPDEKQKKLAEELQKKSEKELITSEHIMVIPLSEIKTVVR